MIVFLTPLNFFKKQFPLLFSHLAASPLHRRPRNEANAAIMAFDVTRKVTYKNLEKWLAQMRRHCMENIPVVCVANKVSNQRLTGSCVYTQPSFYY